MENKDLIIGILIGIVVGLITYKVIDTIGDTICKIELIRQEQDGK
jgi:tetrahydromethanopterin S-methyltransferase subunit G